MTLRRIRQLLWCTACLLLLAAGYVAHWTFQQLDQVPPSALLKHAASSTAGDEQPGTATQPHLPQLSQLNAVTQLDLRRPLHDPKPVVVVPPAPPPPPPLTVRFMGTIIEPGQSLAIFQTRSGQTQMVGEGEPIEDARVLQIKTDEVTLERFGKPVTLKLEGSS